MQLIETKAVNKFFCLLHGSKPVTSHFIYFKPLFTEDLNIIAVRHKVPFAKTMLCFQEMDRLHFLEHWSKPQNSTVVTGTN